MTLDPGATERIIRRAVLDALAAVGRLTPEQREQVADAAASRVVRALAGRYIAASRTAREVFLDEHRRWVAAGKPGRFQVARVARRCERHPRTISRWARAESRKNSDTLQGMSPQRV